MMTDNQLAARGLVPLTDDQIRRAAPSVFATRPHSKTSDRYSFLPTFEVVNGLRANGFMPYAARQSMTRQDGGVMTARHELRFRHVDTMSRLSRTITPTVHKFGTDEVWEEVVLINSHDMTSQFELFQGMFRLACFNGLIVQSGKGDSITVRHTGNIVDNVIEGATRILADTERAVASREGMRALTLDPEDQVQFAEAALQLRYNGAAPITALDLLTPRREEDSVPTLWNTFNVVQENMVKGGLRGHTVNTGRRMTTRGISGITQDVSLNRMLWNLAEAARNMKESLDFTGEQLLAA